MSPRKYTKIKRQETTQSIRRRILDATLALHSENGIFGTSWKDIAHRADVSVATVYNYFPSLDELVPACGELMYAITRPPSLEDASEIFANATSLEDRVGRLITTLFDFYERGEPYLESDHQERTLESVREWEAYLQSLIEGLTRIALEPAKPSTRTVKTVSALLDFHTFLSFRRRNVSISEIKQTIKKLLLSLIS